MTPESLEVLNDAIKILGPAAITGIVAYFTARIQITARLNEIEQTNEFKARERFFNHSKERQAAAGTGAREVLSSLQKLYSRGDGALTEGDRSDLSLLLEHSQAGAEACEREMRRRDLNDKPPYFDLVKAQNAVPQRTKKPGVEITENDIKDLLELVRCWDLCTDLIAEHDLKGWFGKYLS